jgi:hypothetical protein
MVANGPVLGIAKTSVPQYDRGRYTGAVTQLQNCTSEAGITAAVDFRPSLAWDCTGLQGRLSCSVKRRIFAATLAQLVGVAVQAITVNVISSSVRVVMVLRCSVMIGAWPSDSSASLSYATASSVVAAIRNVSSSTFQNDDALRIFDWTTFAELAPSSSTSAPFTSNPILPSSTLPPPSPTATAPPPASSSAAQGAATNALTRDEIIGVSIGTTLVLVAVICLLLFRTGIKKMCLRVVRRSDDSRLQQKLVPRQSPRGVALVEA